MPWLIVNISEVYKFHLLNWIVSSLTVGTVPNFLLPLLLKALPPYLKCVINLLISSLSHW